MQGRGSACLCALVAVTALAGVRADDSGRFTSGRLAMGTLFEITVRPAAGTATGEVESAIEDAFAVISRLDSLLSTYIKSSQISSMNRGAGGPFLGVDPMVIAALDSSLYYWKLTGGAFDVTIGPLVTLWGFKGGPSRVPETREISAALAVVGSDGLVLDRGRNAVRLARDGMSVDLGGIGKGFALDAAGGVLRSRGFANAMLNAGGNLLLLGEAAPGRPWRIGIAHPRSEGATLASFSASDVAVSTSGDYESYFIADGKRYSHIIDPRTGRPVSGIASVTVTAPSATAADALSTAVLVLGLEKGLDLLESLPQVEGVIVPEPEQAGHLELWATSGLKGKLVTSTRAEIR